MCPTNGIHSSTIYIKKIYNFTLRIRQQILFLKRLQISFYFLLLLLNYVCYFSVSQYILVAYKNRTHTHRLLAYKSNRLVSAQIPIFICLYMQRENTAVLPGQKKNYTYTSINSNKPHAERKIELFPGYAKKNRTQNIMLYKKIGIYYTYTT